MHRLQCVGRPSEVSSKINDKETADIRSVCDASADLLPKESVEWKPKQQKPKTSGKIKEQDPSINSKTTSATFKAQGSKRQQKAEPSGKTERQDPSINTETANLALQTPSSKSSRGYNVPKAPSFTTVTTHGHKLPRQVLSVMTVSEKQATSEVQLNSTHELQIHPYHVLSKRDPHEEQREEEEEEGKDNETSGGHVPLELFAEFLQAVMTRNYQLAQKLCQMILIYEPQNSEAKSFLPLIEEKLMIEAEKSDNESAESDPPDEEEDSSDDDESLDSSDTDEESSDSTDDTSSSS